MKTINHGKVNDCQVLAILVNGRLIPLSGIDLEFQDADYCINYDSGVYPIASSVEEYICDQVSCDLDLH